MVLLLIPNTANTKKFNHTDKFFSIFTATTLNSVKYKELAVGVASGTLVMGFAPKSHGRGNPHCDISVTRAVGQGHNPIVQCLTLSLM